MPDPNQPDNGEFRFFDFLACLLHCCADDPQELGVAKAFKVVAAGDVRVTHLLEKRRLQGLRQLESGCLAICR